MNRGFIQILSLIVIPILILVLVGSIFFKSYKKGSDTNNSAVTENYEVAETITSTTTLTQGPTITNYIKKSSLKTPTPSNPPANNSSSDNSNSNTIISNPTITTSPIAYTSTPTITNSPTPTMSRFARILTPNGGETLQQGSNYLITWESSPDITSITLYYILSTSPNGGNGIAQNLPNTGSFNWNVSLSGVTQPVQVKLDLEAHHSTGLFDDKSDNYFTVLPPN